MVDQIDNTEFRLCVNLFQKARTLALVFIAVVASMDVRLQTFGK